MKISCQSCQAKYTIADEKVLGKIVKIRCKKCGATIVINGNETGAATGPQESVGAFDYAATPSSSGEQWTVNVADGDQRTMTPQEIVDEFKAGVVTDETYCWKDGMADWLPLREIDELYSMCTGAGAPASTGLTPDSTHQEQPSFQPSFPAPQQEPAAASPPPPEASPGYLFGNGATNGNGNGASAGLFNGGSSPSSPPAAARRQGGRTGAGADLFGGVAQAGAEDDVMTSAPAGMPQVSPSEPGKMTGQRNENSVLFSLSALTQNSPKEEAAPPPPGAEGSGLIDIRALSATMGGKEDKKSGHVDDIMNLGGGGAFSAALAAPVLAPPPMDTSAVDVGGAMTGGGKQNKTILFGIIGGGGLIALAIVLVFALKKPEAPPVAVGPTPTAPTETAAPAATTAPADTSTAAGNAPPTAAPPGTGQASAANDNAPSTTHHASGGGHAGAKASEPKDTTPAVPPPVAEKPSKPASLGDALKSAVGDTGGGGAPAAASGGGSAPFDRGAAAAALSSVNVQSCAKPGGPTGGGHVKVTFAPSGAVSTAIVDQPPFAGTPVGGCVAGKFRGAHIPAFSGSPVTVGKSFVIN